MAWNDINNGESGASVRSKLNILGADNETKQPKALAESHILLGDDSGQAAAVPVNEVVLPVIIDGEAGDLFLEGNAVYISGQNPSGKPVFSLADSSNPATMPAVGLAPTAASAEEVLIVSGGAFTGVDTSAFSVGDALYVGSNGSLTNVKPTGASLIQKMGIVARSHASAGSIIVQGAGRSNDLPNLPQGQVWEGDENGVPQAVTLAEQSTFTFNTTELTGNFTAAWSNAYILDNTTKTTVTLPAAAAGDAGKEIKVWLKNNPANAKVIFTADDLSGVVNDQVSEGAEKAKAEVGGNESSFERVTIQCAGEDKYFVSSVTSTYAELRYVVSFDSTDIFSPYHYLKFSGIPTNFLTSNDSWWAALKIEQPMTNDSTDQVLFCSDSFYFAYRGNGTFFSNSDGFQYPLFPTTIIQAGQWLIYQYNSVTGAVDAWVNGAKVLDGASLFTAPPSTPPTDIRIGSEVGYLVPPPYGFAYPLTSCKMSAIAIGSGVLSDSDAALFTSNTYTTPAIIGGTVTNEWNSDGAGMVTQTGAISLTPERSSDGATSENISFGEL